MKLNEIRRIVLKYAKEHQKQIIVKKIILFGSYAYGNLTKSSDIDIAVISDRFKKMNDISRIMQGA